MRRARRAAEGAEKGIGLTPIFTDCTDEGGLCGWLGLGEERATAQLDHFQCVSFRLSVKAGMVVGEILRNPMVAR